MFNGLRLPSGIVLACFFYFERVHICYCNRLRVYDKHNTRAQSRALTLAPNDNGWKLKALVSFLFSGEEWKHRPTLFLSLVLAEWYVLVSPVCVRKHTPRLLGGNIGVVGYTLQWAPHCCQNAHCSAVLPRKLFLNAFLLTCSLHHNASKCLLNV